MHALYIELLQMLNLLLIYRFLNRFHVLFSLYLCCIWELYWNEFISNILLIIIESLLSGSLNTKFVCFRIMKWRKINNIFRARAIYCLTLSLPSFQFAIHFPFRSRLCKWKSELTHSFVNISDCIQLSFSADFWKSQTKDKSKGKKASGVNAKRIKETPSLLIWSKLRDSMMYFYLYPELWGWKIASCRERSVVDHPCHLSLSRLLILARALSLSRAVSPLPFSLAFCLTLAICLPVWFSLSSAFIFFDASSSEYWSFQLVV